MNPRKRACRGKNARWPNLDENLANWVLSQRDSNRAVSSNPTGCIDNIAAVVFAVIINKSKQNYLNILYYINIKHLLRLNLDQQ